MKNRSFIPKMTKWTLPLMVALSNFSTISTAAFAQSVSPEGHYRTEQGQIIFNLGACKNIPCTLNFQGATLRVTTGKSIPDGIYMETRESIQILSSLPIENIETNITPQEPFVSNKKV